MASWTVIFRKYFFVKRSTQQVDEFEDRFWHGVELMQLLDSARRNKDASGIEERIFEAGMNEFLKQNRQDPHALNSVSRAMKAVYTREMDRMEAGLPLLASIGSTAPYIGLFGTVWGIMHAFMALSGAKQATLQMVAPGIAEALIATAIGLFAAIPAVMAYNRLSLRVNAIEQNYGNFIDEFTTILHRQAFGKAPH